jgi:class 3 adenylate cyclase/tetratricopeptide (TPR) repeat protein
MSFQSVEDIREVLGSGDVSVRDLYTAWEQRQPIPETIRKRDETSRVDAPHLDWFQDLSLASVFTKKALDTEEFLLVCDAAREALRLWPSADDDERTKLIRVRMHYAEALMRLGFTRDARNELGPCLEENFRPKLGRLLKADILLKLGDILREESHYATARATRLQTAEEALGFYQEALKLDPERLEALLSCAACGLTVSEPNSAIRERACETARNILALIAKLEDTDGPRVNTTRAKAVAHVVLGDTDSAGKSYRDLQDIEGVSTSQLAEARFRSRVLAEAIGKPADFFKEAFPPLQLIVFAGHLPDRAGESPRFPVDMIDDVREILRRELATAHARVGLVSAAAGADLLFIEALNARQGTFHVILPWAKEVFRQTSVKPFEPPNQPPIWEPLFDRALNDAVTVRQISQVYEPGNSAVGWEFLMEVSSGMALSIARALRLDVQPMVLWDGVPMGKGAGGTQSFYSFWSDQLRQPPLIVPLPHPKNASPRSAIPFKRDRSERSTLHQEVKSMLFADIVGYSKLTEHVIPEFVETFLTRVSQLAASSKYAPRHVNTWGDAIYAVFDFAHDAGCFALQLTQMIKENEKEWLRQGLYWEEQLEGEAVWHPLSIRISLHTGPVFMHYNPVVRQLGFTGSHVSFAARIEPITKPGEVFASEEFASLSELSCEIERRSAAGSDNNSEGNAGFFCDYAGTMQLAKGYPGRYRIYRLLPKRVFAIEELARAAHDSYLVEAKARGETLETNSAFRLWEELPEDLREANRAQVADIPNKLRRLGYELAPGHGIHPSEIKITDAQIDELAIREHDRWMNDRIRHGWTYSSTRDNARKQHNLLVPWDELSEPEKEKDRDTVRNLPFLIQKAGFRVRKISQ